MANAAWSHCESNNQPTKRKNTYIYISERFRKNVPASFSRTRVEDQLKA